MTNAADMNLKALEEIFNAGATVISHLIDKKISCSVPEVSQTDTSLKLHNGWIILLAEIPAGDTSFIVRFEKSGILELVKIMMGGGEELGAIGDSMTAEITAQIASTMAEEIATKNAWPSLGIVAKVCENEKSIPPPPLHTYLVTMNVEEAFELKVAIDFDVASAARVGIQTSGEAASRADRPTKTAKIPQAASFTQMTPTTVKVKDHSLELVHDVPMTVRALLGSSHVQLRDVVAMQAGTVFELNRSSEEPIDLFVNNILIARGEVVVVDDRYAVKIRELNPGGT